MKNWLAKNKVVAIIVAAVVVIAGAGTAGYLLTRSPEEASQQYEFNFYESEVKDLGTPDDVGVMLSDCDGPDSWAEFTYGNFTSQEGRYVQGTAGIETAGLVGIGAVPYGIFNDVDASAYEDGSFHISIYIENPQKFTNVVAFELGSGAKWDVDEYQWYVHPSLFKSGWNELYLGMDDVELITGEPDITRLNYFRVYANGSTIGVGDVYLDNLYMTDTPGMSLEPVAGQGEVASTKPGYLLDFDSLTGVSASGSMSFSTAEGEFTEGKGGLVVQNIPDECWFYANIEPFDITKYKGGKFIIPLYISDASHIKDSLICFEMSSSGTWDKQEMFWLIDSSKLKTGWNYVKVLIDSNQAMADTDLKNLNFIRIWGTNCSDDFFFMVDAIEYHPATTITPKDGMFINCDTEDGYQVIVGNNEFSVTTADKEHKQGTGAYKTVGNEIIWWRIVTEDLVNISKFEDGGLKFWLYVDDVTKIKEPIMVEAGSAGVEDVDEYQWSVGGLKNGWNQVALRFDEALVTGEPNLKAMNFFRVFGERSDNVVTILDAVQAANIAKKVAEPGMILPCDDYANIATLYTQEPGKISITDLPKEHKEGTAAFKNTGGGQVRYHIILTNPVDISDFKKGALNLQLYIGDKKAFKSSYITVEITSAGNSDKNECSWRVYLADLESNSWNDLTLNFSEIEVQDESVGKMDFSKVNYFRIWTEQEEKDVTFILDAVKAVKDPLIIEKKEGAILSCDNVKGIIIPSAKDMTGSSMDIDKKDYKEGIGSYVITGPNKIVYNGGYHPTTGAYIPIDSDVTGMIVLKANLASPVDISKFYDAEDANGKKTGGIEFWLYIDNANNWNGQLAVELGSGGIEDTAEIQWHLSGLKTGWQKIQLGFADKVAGNEKHEKGFDPSQINHIRIYQEAGEKKQNYKKLTVKIDDICAVDTLTSSVLEEGQILTCDDAYSLKTLIADNGITVTDQNVREGSGAFQNSGGGYVLFSAVLKEGVDCTKYADGALRFWLYIKEQEAIANSTLIVELGSTDAVDEQEIQWQNYKGHMLKEGWNEIVLNMDLGQTVGSAIDLQHVTRFRLMADPSVKDKDFAIILDDVHMTEEKFQYDEGDMILSGDYVIGLTDVASVNATYSVVSDKVQGSGSIESTAQVATPVIFFQAGLGRTMSVVDYKEGGVHMSLYVEDKTTLTGPLFISLGSGGGDSDDFYKWEVNAGPLQTGWNELYLPFSKVDGVNGMEVGDVDDQYINWFRVHAETITAETTIRIDDVRVVSPSTLSIFDCDRNDIFVNPGVVAVSKDIQYVKEGAGAFLQPGGMQVLYPNMVLKAPLDISEYDNATGEIKLDLFISDVDSWNGDVCVEVGSGGTENTNSIVWKVDKTALTDGWNSIALKIQDSGQQIIGIYGTIDWSKLNYMRLYQSLGNATGDLTVALDNVRVEGTRTVITKIDIINCDDTSALKTAAGLEVATVGGVDNVFSQIAKRGIYKLDLNNSVNGSKLAKGKLQFKYYIEDISKYNTAENYLEVRLGTNSSNYKTWHYSLSKMQTGWNTVEISLSSKEEKLVGTFDIKTLQYVLVQPNNRPQVITALDDVCIVAAE